jgi:hypothetical protein
MVCHDSVSRLRGGAPARRRLLWSGIASLVLLGGGCAGPEATARKSFSQGVSCPVQRITVTKEHGRPYQPPPPPEVANDPERLALYQHSNETYYRASGCNEETFFRCFRPEVTEPAWQCDRILPPPGWLRAPRAD